MHRTTQTGGHTMGRSDSSGWDPQVESSRLRILATHGSERTTRWPNEKATIERMAMAKKG